VEFLSYRDLSLLELSYCERPVHLLPGWSQHVIPAWVLIWSMLTTHPHLRIRRPSPSTVEFTVSTIPQQSIPLQLLFLATILARSFLGLSTLLLLYCKWALSPYASPVPPFPVVPPILSNDFIWYTIESSHKSPIGVLFTNIAAHIPAALLIPASAFVAYQIVLRIHTSESLLVLRGLGIQTSTSSTTYLGTASTRFIPTEKIQDILVNEAFRGFEVRYYLIVVVKGEDEVVVVFPRLLPCRDIVEKVWRGARKCLYDMDTKTKLENHGHKEDITVKT
jgi:phosphatidylinositol glycan class H protein